MTSYYWDEALPELVPELDWSSITPEQWEKISEALDEHVSTASEFDAPTPSSRDIAEMNYRPEREAMRDEIARLEEQVLAYRKSVADRRGVPLRTVGLDNSGRVTFGEVFR